MENRNTSFWARSLRPAWESRSVALIRLAVGAIFLTQGPLKFMDPAMGVGRFVRIGFAHPAFTAHLVGGFEVVCGALVLLGLLTRWGAAPLLVIISTAIALTKLPEIGRAGQGFWFMVSDARTDFAMLLSLLFLLYTGAGGWSIDSRLARPRKPASREATAKPEGATAR